MMEGGLVLLQDVHAAALFKENDAEVQALLSELRKETGLALEMVPVRLNELYEVCDQCGKMVTPVAAFFDGQKYLCSGCRRGDGGPSGPR